ncbi:MAG: CDP-alcohol phosphatidyltransferase family protein [Jatrophihabitans sp.]|nr:MAG: CDP-alcohol phosphatidyltransferase family protein [Jatrophihabitans sp.]
MPASETAGRDRARREWSRLHGGIDPRRLPLLDLWLRGMWVLARPLAALRVAPLTLTALGAALALAALALAGVLPAAALALVLLASVCDGLDGAVAVLAGRASRLGSGADKLADRVADCAFALVIWRCGAPLWLAVAAGSLSLLHEVGRSVLAGPRRFRLTVAERPTRVVCTVLACLCAAVSAAHWPATVCAAVWTALALAGLAQLAPAGPSTARGRAPRRSGR